MTRWRFLLPKTGRDLFMNCFMSVLIILNALAMIIGTLGAIQQEYDWILVPFENISLIISSVEYIILLWVCTKNPAFTDPLRRRINYVLTSVALITLYLSSRPSSPS